MSARRQVTIAPEADGKYSVRFAYDEDINNILRLHRGWWERQARCWMIRDQTVADSVLDALRVAGYSVGWAGSKQFRPPPPPSHPRIETPHVDVLAELLADFGLPAYRALTKVTHPDVGGSLVWSQRVNAAWERAQRRAG